MEEIDFQLSPETTQALTEAMQAMSEAAKKLYDALTEVVLKVMEQVRKFAEMLGRFFLNQLLLEWRIPAPIADYISQKMYWVWACRIGFAWFERKLAMIE